MKNRCAWAEGKFAEYVQYHDEEWGIPVFDDRVHFEFLLLESAQAGLSWATILKKRASYRQAFADFDPEVVVVYNDAMVETLLTDKGIIRNKLKIKAAISNAQAFLKIQETFGSFSHYIWSFVDGKTITGHWKSIDQVPVTTPQSDALAKDMKKRGFKFLGSTTLYAHMQACGLVNDHTIDCFRYKQILGAL